MATNTASPSLPSLPDTELQAAVSALIERQVAEGRQIGLQVCVMQGGEVVADAVAGVMGPDDPRPVQPDTLFLSFSVTKGVASLALHQLADAGMVDLDAPVVQYWPEFGRHGKDRLTVAQAASHQAGLHAMPDPVTLEHLTDWEAALRRMEDGVPAYEPGTATGYHAVTFAWIMGGIVAGAGGGHLGERIRTHIAEPLGIADEMYVGIPDVDAVRSRLATLAIVPAGEGAPIPPEHDFFKAMPQPMWVHFNGDAVRHACIPSANGHFTARALARMYSALAGDGSVDGVRMLSAEATAAASSLVVTDEVDRVLMAPIAKGVGFFHGGEPGGVPGLMGPRRTAFGHPGAGGPVGFADPELGLAIGITSNKMQYPLPGEGPTLEICLLIRSMVH